MTKLSLHGKHTYPRSGARDVPEASPRAGILLVDDRPENLLALEAILGGLGLDLVTARSGDEALRRLLDRDFAVVLLDVQMEGLDGFETARMIRRREKSRHTPIIFVTAHAEGDFPVAEAYALGAVDYLVKPLVPEVIRSKVAVFVELYQKREQVRLQAERLQAEAESNLRMVVESVHDYAILSTDTAGRIVTWNSGAERVFGWSESEAIGRDVALLFVPEDRERGIPERERAEAIGAGRAEDERWHVRKDGSRFYASGMMRPIRDGRGRPCGFTKVARDMTEQRRAEEERARLLAREQEARREAEAASRAKDQFLAVLSHELRTPLNPILLATSAILEGPEEPEEVRPTLEMIRQNVNLQARLIDDLLDVMRIVRGKMPLHWEVADGHRLIDQAIQICRSEVFCGELRLELDLAATHRHVNADPARLQQVFWNLIKNAVKFTPEGGTITIRTRNEDGQGVEHLVVEVSDTGIGIEPEVLPRIFDPFQQGETTITRKFGGLGLGLAICKGIVDAHGGTIGVESGGKGRGTTFRVVLKALPEQAVGGDGEPVGGFPEADRRHPSPLRVLVVEDEPATLRLMARLIRGLGHAVTTAGTIASAYEAFEAGEFDLIVSDIGLPDGTGLELMRRVVALRGRIPAIALTGYGMEDDIIRSREAGFTAHMTKPIDFTKLEAMIRQVAN